ncbi:hypothetical protein SprV_0501856800 [Sparganum proliferum]
MVPKQWRPNTPSLYSSFTPTAEHPAVEKDGCAAHAHLYDGGNVASGILLLSLRRQSRSKGGPEKFVLVAGVTQRLWMDRLNSQTP